MKDTQMGTVESRFADIIWQNEPVLASELAKICEKELSWKKTTTYTVLKRLCEKGIFKNSGGEVTSLIKRDEFYSLKSERFVNETFEGSLPAFLTAFCSRKSLKPDDIKALRQMIEQYGEE